MYDAFDILRKLPDGGIVWLESAKDLQSARQRIQLFASLRPGEYVIFSQATQSVIAMPWVPFARHAVQATDCRPRKVKQTQKAEGRGKGATKKETLKKEARGKHAAELPAPPKTTQVIAGIVSDISRTLRHK